jgi:hypothetical protein
MNQPHPPKITRRIYERFIKLKGAPREIALGFSLGLMIGMTPFLGAHFVSSILLASLLGWSKLAALVGANITNVFTAPLIYPINYWVGYKLVGVSGGVQWPSSFIHVEWIELVKQSPLILVDLCAGGLILGIPLAAAGYLVALRGVRMFRREKVQYAQG